MTSEMVLGVPSATVKVELIEEKRKVGRPATRLIGWMFAVAILALWVASAVADPVTLRMVAAAPGYTVEGRPSITITLDDDGLQTLSQFTYEHLGEDIEWRSEGRLLMKARLRTTITGGKIQVVGDFVSDETGSLASRLAIDGKIEVNALGRRRR
jgi:hypothetical protein